MPFKVLVCDDDPELAAVWMRQIEAAVSSDNYQALEIPDRDRLSKAVAELLERRAQVREGKAHQGAGGLFDDADIVVIDYDLLHVEDSDTRYTGEGIARVARAFSTCGLIIVLNQYPEAQFDLSLRGHLSSHADLNIDGDLIGRVGLWTPPPWDGFRPWHWSVLADAASRFRARSEALAKDGALDKAILATLGLVQDDVVRLSDSAFGFVAPAARDVDALAAQTFRQFILGNSAAADPKDGEKLLEVDPAACARIAASRVAKWLERDLLSPQDVLVDLPHAVQRFPFLMRPDALPELDAWNALARGDLSVLQRDLIPKEAWFNVPNWLGRPALLWSRLEKVPALADLRMDFDYSTVPDFVFMEDVSQFCHRDAAVEFRAGFHNEFDRRFIKKVADVKYAPQRRLAFAD